jgi:capsular exopolysaccharide synthesis family protein
LSRNFELLSQVGKMQDIAQTPEPPLAPILEDAGDESTVFTASLSVPGAVRDEIVKLVRNLFFVPGESAPRRVVFTGTESGTGCSWICAQAAEILASQVHGSVCVVDCNLRAPSLHQRFDVPNHHGLTDALLNPGPLRSYLQRLSRSNLWLLSSGSVQENQPSLLSSDSMRTRLGELYAQFDYVLLDVASLNTCNDGIALGSSADGVVIVVRANASRREIARKTLQELQAAKVQALGVVLNQRTFPIPEAIYKLF